MIALDLSMDILALEVLQQLQMFAQKLVETHILRPVKIVMTEMWQTGMDVTLHE